MRISKRALLALGILGSASAFAQTFTETNPAGRGRDQLSAYEIFYSMYDQTTQLANKEVFVQGARKGSQPVTFGAEKEGSSSKILRVLSPDAVAFENVLTAYPDSTVQIITDFISGRSRLTTPVLNYAGVAQSVDPGHLAKLKAADWSRFTADNVLFQPGVAEEFGDLVRVFIYMFPQTRGGGRPFFSFIKPEYRRKYWEMQNEHQQYIFRRYDSWFPLFGESELYADHGHKELNDGWEVIFLPQVTYADFEKQIRWFRELMGTGEELFEAPGHNRVVMPRIERSPRQDQLFTAHAGELNRMIQAYVLLRGLSGKTGLLGARHKDILTESELADLNSGRGIIRLEKDRFYKDSLGIEFRVGMKDEAVRRFLQAIYVSRIAANDMNDLATLKSYELIPEAILYNSLDVDATVNSAARRFRLEKDVVRRAIDNWSDTEKADDQSVFLEMMVPLWRWENAPFAKAKKESLRRISRDFFVRLAAMEKPDYDQVSDLVSQWVKASNLVADIEHYVTPKKPVDHLVNPLEIAIADGQIDVNKIDLGNEFTARMPLKLRAEYDQNRNWVQTVYDMTPAEREKTIRGVAESLATTFTGSKESVTKLDQGSHGHSLVIAFELRDKENRKWRVEWDGVNRSYDRDGNIIDESARGGHIEIVSPKYNPNYEQIQAVYSAMSDAGLIADHRSGGAHINVDYTIFEKNPEALARFLRLFHKHRGTIAFLFQHVNRLRSAEPVDISPELDRQLANFRGSAEDLARILYNGHYFNGRMNRKTRYNQLDLSNFMGEVIPQRLIQADFDVVKARATGGLGWIQQFRVTPYKKMEFRLFDAASDELEAASQIKLVRALLNRALNDTTPIVGGPQKVDYRAYLADPQKAYADLKTMTDELHLDYLDYSLYVTGKLAENGRAFANPNFVPWLERADREAPEVSDWGRARTAASGRVCRALLAN